MRFVLIDQVIEANLDALFLGMEIVEHHLFRVTRNADLAIEEDEADDLLLAIEEELRRRRFGEAVRLEVERSMPAGTRLLLLRGLGLADDDCYEVSGMLDLTGLGQIAELNRPELQRPTWTPVVPARLLPPDEDTPTDTFAVDPGRRPARASPVRVIRRVRGAVHHPGRRRSRRPLDQADAVPDLGRLADRPVAHPRGRARQAGRGPRRDQGTLRRGGEHRLGPQARAGRRARRLRTGRAQDTLEDRARRPTRGLRRAPLRPHRDGQLQPQDRAAVRGPWPALGPPRALRRRDRPVQRPDRPVAPAHVPSPARGAAQPALALPPARRPRDRPRPGRPRGADRPQAQRHRRRPARSRRSTAPRRPGCRST